MREIIFWGATGQARVLAEAIRGTDLRLVALVDNRELPGELPGVSMLHGEAGLVRWLALRPEGPSLCGAVAIGGDRGRDRLDILEIFRRNGIAPLTLVHGTAFVAADASLGEGCQVLAQAAVCTHARLGRGVIINTAASVDHDCVLGDGVHVAPGARLAGEVTVGPRSFIGTGAVIVPRVRIGEDVIVGAGAVVLGDVSDGTTVVGNPARPLAR